MPATLETISREALILPPAQRLVLARQLLDSVEPAPEAGADAAWDQEIRERISRFDAGESETVPGEEVFGRLRQIAPER
jgi:putative addiction module component (TIGR02574 family)